MDNERLSLHIGKFPHGAFRDVAGFGEGASRMEIVLGAVVGFPLLVAMLVSTRRFRAARGERLRALYARRRALTVDLRTLQENAQQLKMLAHELRRKLPVIDERVGHAAEQRKQGEAHGQYPGLSGE